MSKGWIGVDLDGTLARYTEWQGIENIGEPIQPMLDRVKRWIAAGHTVKIFTARVGGDFAEAEAARGYIRVWLDKHLGQIIEVTCVKDFGMIELWDDRAVQVIANTGEPVGKSTRGLD